MQLVVYFFDGGAVHVFLYKVMAVLGKAQVDVWFEVPGENQA